MGEGGAPFMPLQLRQNEAAGRCPVCEGQCISTLFREMPFFSTFGKSLDLRRTELECPSEEDCKRAATFVVCSQQVIDVRIRVSLGS